MNDLNKIKEIFNIYKETKISTPTICCPLCVYKNFFESIGYKIINFNINEWDLNFWMDCYNSDLKDWVSLQGSWFYGDFKFTYFDNYEQYNKIIKNDI